MPVTLKDIANRVGLSVTTVSRALNDYDDVSPATKALIRRVAQEMGYRPDATAQKLQKGRTDTIGFVIPTFGPRFSDPFFSEFLAGLGNQASEENFDVLVSTRAPGPEEDEAYRRLVESRRVDGLIIVRTRHHDPRIAYLADQRFPFCAFGRSDLGVDFPYVDVDGTQGLREAVGYLVGLGHRRIGYIAAPGNLMFNTFRLQGYRQGLEEHGIPFEPDLVVEGDLTERGGFQAAQKLLARHPTAILAGNDLTALGAIRAAQEAGLEVGRDISVIGFDDIPLAEHTHPPLTTLRQPIYQIGKTVCRMLLQVIRGEPVPDGHVILSPELVIRQSTGPAPAGE